MEPRATGHQHTPEEERRFVKRLSTGRLLNHFPRATRRRQIRIPAMTLPSSRTRRSDRKAG